MRVSLRHLAGILGSALMLVIAWEFHSLILVAIAGGYLALSVESALEARMKEIAAGGPPVESDPAVIRTWLALPSKLWPLA